MKDLAETAEIATLDKEMAEEKYEQMSKDYEQLKEKFEEVNVDFELLKSEVEMKGSDGAASTYEVKQLKQQNARYSEAILKLKDILAADKHEMQSLAKELKEAQIDQMELKKSKEKYEKEIQEYEENVSELKEQIDFALGAQEMVEMLTQKNLELEDKVGTLQEEIDDLENLHEINEQIQESARESELELREELDMQRTKISSLIRKLEDDQEAFANYEGTILNFRKLVSKLKEENAELSKNSNILIESSQKQQLVENIEFKMRFEESKAFSRAIETNLKRLEVNQLKSQIEHLSKFMPSSFFITGGDHDAIQILLFVPRMIEKCNIISSQILEKYPFQENNQVITFINPEAVIKESTDTLRQQVFIRRLNFLLTSIQAILAQYSDALKMCSIDLYLKIASLLPELLIHEKIFDNYRDLLKKDQLDETVSLQPLDKALLNFISLFHLHIADNKVNDCRQLLTNFVAVLKFGIDIAFIEISLIESLLNPRAVDIDYLNLVKNYINDVSELCKKIRRRLIASTAPLFLSAIFENELRDCIIQVNKAASALHNIVSLIKEDAQKNMSSDESVIYPSIEAIDKIAASTGGFKFLEVSFNGILAVCNQISIGFQQGDFETDSKGQEKQGQDDQKSNPFEARAKYITQQSGQLSELKIKLENKNIEINELKKLVKTKMDETDEMKIRRDVAEKKLNLANKNSDERVTKLQAEVDELKMSLKKKEKEYEETLNHFQADIEALESERGELKDKVKLLSKKNIFDSLAKSSPIVLANSSLSSSSFTPLETSYIKQISALKHALKMVKDENISLKCKMAEKQLKSINVNFNRRLDLIKSNWVIKLIGKEKELIRVESESYNDNCASVLDNQREVLIRRVEDLQKELILNIINQKGFDLKKPLCEQLIQEKFEARKLSAKYKDTVEDVENFLVDEKSKNLFN